MKKFLFALVLGCAFAVTATADPPATITAPPVITGTVPTTPGIVIGSDPTTAGVYPTAVAPTRRSGLFGRFRNRGTTQMMSSPVYAPATVTVPGTTIPTPMPAVTPAPRPGGTSSAFPGVTGSPVIVAGGTVVNNGVIPAGGVVTAPDGTLVAMAPMAPMAPMVMTTTTQRMGLIARLRARR